MMLFTSLYENYTIAFFSRFLKYCWILKTVQHNKNIIINITSEDIAPIMSA